MIGNYTRVRQNGEEDFIAQINSSTKCLDFWRDFFTGLFEKAGSGAWTGASINFGNFQFITNSLGANVGFDVKDKNNNNFLIKFAKDDSNLNPNACSIRAYSDDGTSEDYKTLAKVSNNSCSCNFIITDDAIILWAPRSSYKNTYSGDADNDATYLMIFRLNTNGSEVTLAAWSHGIRSGNYTAQSSGETHYYFAPVSIILNKNGGYEIDAWITGTQQTSNKGLGTHLALQNSKNGAGDRNSIPIVYDETKFDNKLWMPMIFSFENIVDPELTVETKNLYNSHLYVSSPYKSITRINAQGTFSGDITLEKPCFTYVTLGNKKGIRLPYIFTQFQYGAYALFDTVYFYKN